MSEEKSQVVHVLFSKVAVCGFSPKQPKNWSEGHSFVEIMRYKDATCQMCVEGARKIIAKTENKLVRSH